MTKKKERKKDRYVTYVFMGARRMPGACEIYRGTMPLYFLRQSPTSRWDGQWMYFEDLLQAWNTRGQGAWDELINITDLFVFPRIYFPDAHPEMRLAAAALFYIIRNYNGIGKDSHKRILFEADDDYTNTYRKVADGNIIEILSWTDGMTVTSDYLGRLFQKAGANRPFHVLPNMVDPLLWADPEGSFVTDPAEPLIIGLSGSATHGDDWLVMKDVLPPLLERYKDKLKLKLTGFWPDYLKGLADVEYTKAIPYPDYSQMVRKCDIILAPVNDDKFNLGKSPIKVLEGMVAERQLNGTPAGAAVVATDHPIYNRSIKHEKTGLLVPHTANDWYKTLERLILDTPFRHELQMAGHRWVLKHHDIRRTYTMWTKVYDNIMRKPPNSIKLPLPDFQEAT